MAETAPKKRVLLTPRFRVSFPQVFKMSAFEGSAPRYSLTGLFYPKKFTEDEKTKWLAIKAALNVASVEGFKKPMKDLDRSAFKLPFHKGDSKSYEGYGDPDMVFFAMGNTKRKPQILDTDGVSYITSENPDAFYAGCWARASVNPYWFNNIGKGLSVGLMNIQKLGDDKSFEGFTTADDDFGGEASEFDAGSDETDEFGDGAGDDPSA